MHLRLPAARPTAVAALALAATAVVVPSAHSAEGDDYRVTLTSSTAATDHRNRTVDLTGTVTRPDGTPVADAPVQLEESVLFNTWNPWGDPIDPTEWETRGLGTVRTDAEGRFTLEDVPADRADARPSPYLFPRHQVMFRAVYDTDPADLHMAFADTTVKVKPITGLITYQNARTTTDALGNFTVRTRIRDYDNEFVIFSAPKDYYIAGASRDLPVRNVTP